MTFLAVVLRGLLRRPLRTGFTLAGISIGIAAVVALVGMSRGFQKGWQLGLKARGTDIVVNNRVGGLTPKPFDASIRDRIARLPHIGATCRIGGEPFKVWSARARAESAPPGLSAIDGALVSGAAVTATTLRRASDNRQPTRAMP